MPGWRLPSSAALVFAALAAAQDGYVRAEACKTCHASIWQTYHQTGMGRSFSRIDALGDRDRQEAKYYHAASRRHYAFIRRGDRYFLRRHQTGPGGEEENLVEKEVQYVIGSGNHSRTYLHRAPDGTLIELPVSWYAGEGGHWAMSPGYEGPRHQDFRRPVPEDCLFCHNAYPAVAGGGIPEGIDCQRCHGPGREHVQSAGKAAILNPRRLPPARQMEICLQCHLETTSRPLPNAIRRYDRAPFSFRPGEPLENYILHFDHAGGHEDKFEVNHAAYRLRQSQCFLRSAEKMTCTTCHDPHDAARRDYARVCQSCHAKPHTTANCIDCHMPKRPADDAVHIRMTDHRIERGIARVTASRRSAGAAYTGPVALYYPRALPGTPENRLYLADAQVKEFANLEKGIVLLEKAITAAQPKAAEFYLDLAEAYWKTGRNPQAVRFYEEAVRRKPDLAKAWRNCGEVLLRMGQLSRAIDWLERGLEALPVDAPVLTTLGVAYGQAGRVRDAIRSLSKAVELNPDLPEAWANLAAARQMAGDRAEADQARRTAIRLQPDLLER